MSHAAGASQHWTALKRCMAFVGYDCLVAAARLQPHAMICAHRAGRTRVAAMKQAPSCTWSAMAAEWLTSAGAEHTGGNCHCPASTTHQARLLLPNTSASPAEAPARQPARGAGGSGGGGRQRLWGVGRTAGGDHESACGSPATTRSAATRPGDVRSGRAIVGGQQRAR